MKRSTRSTPRPIVHRALLHDLLKSSCWAEKLPPSHHRRFKSTTLASFACFPYCVFSRRVSCLKRDTHTKQQICAGDWSGIQQQLSFLHTSAADWLATSGKVVAFRFDLIRRKQTHQGQDARCTVRPKTCSFSWCHAEKWAEQPCDLQDQIEYSEQTVTGPRPESMTQHSDDV